MTKNITVTDENGNIIGSTYPKRALGLVKKGRARWINENVICLCARDETEEITMASNIYEVLDNQISKIQEQLRGPESAAYMPVYMQILETLEDFRKQEKEEKVLGMVKEQLDAMQKQLNAETPTAENAAAREVTRQKMLDLMQSMVSGDTKTPASEVKPAEKTEVKAETETKTE